jgi:hypothetical protein
LKLCKNAGTTFFNQLKVPLNSNTTTPLHLKDILKDKFRFPTTQEFLTAQAKTCLLLRCSDMAIL